jgi:PAS domain S-box-containing protein
VPTGDIRGCIALNSIAARFDVFLSSLLEEYGPAGVLECFSFLFDAFEITRDGVVIAASDSFVELMGYTREALLGMHALELIAEDERAAMVRRFAEGNTDRYRLKLLLQDGSTLKVLVMPRAFQAGGITYRLAEFVDISAQAAIEEHLAESEEKYHSVFEQAAVGIARVSC